MKESEKLEVGLKPSLLQQSRLPDMIVKLFHENCSLSKTILLSGSKKKEVIDKRKADQKVREQYYSYRQ